MMKKEKVSIFLIFDTNKDAKTKDLQTHTPHPLASFCRCALHKVLQMANRQGMATRIARASA